MSDIRAPRRWRSAIVWFRRDLRVHDHPALLDAVEHADHVYPLFVFDEPLLSGRWHLTDGDLANNNGGWQWTASVGTDRQPIFRIFDPTLQATRFDPAGEFVRRWVPELADVPLESIHEPWRMSPEVQERVGCVIGRDYPAPIVDHAEARARALDAFRS